MNGLNYVRLLAGGLRLGTVTRDASVQLSFDKGQSTYTTATNRWTGVQEPLRSQLNRMSQEEWNYLLGEGYFTRMVGDVYVLNADTFEG